VKPIISTRRMKEMIEEMIRLRKEVCKTLDKMIEMLQLEEVRPKVLAP